MRTRTCRPTTSERIEQAVSLPRGAFGAADAMYAPVVSRFHTYAADLGAEARAYVQAVMALPAWSQWYTAARTEPWVLAEDEVDWPTVLPPV